MRRAGVELRWFRPPGRWRVWTRGRFDNRTHRKILVTDGSAAFTGGAGVSQEWDGDARGPEEWRDTFFRIDGPVVAGFRAAFFAHWARARGRGDSDVESVGPGPRQGEAEVMVVPSVATERWSAAATLLQFLPREARRMVRITTPYFVPNEETLPNMNSRSTKKDDEILAVVLDRELAATLEGHFADDARASASMRADKMEVLPPGRRLLEAFVRLFRKQL